MGCWCLLSRLLSFFRMEVVVEVVVSANPLGFLYGNVAHEYD